jgi:lysophospholipase L1-like esterase
MRAPADKHPAAPGPDLAWRLAAVSLAPLLLAQGLVVRRVTPRLPEPPGPRSGTAGQGPTLRVLIAGDSAAAGVGASTQQEGLAGCVVRELASYFSVAWTIDARNGRRTGGQIARLEAREPEPFDVALLSLGVNDVTGGTRSAVFVRQQHGLVELLKSRFGVRHVLLTCLPPMHAFPALPQPLRWTLGARARHFTRLLGLVAAADATCEVVTPRLPLDPACMASDGFHPGPPAYAEWGREAAQIIRRRIDASIRDSES